MNHRFWLGVVYVAIIGALSNIAAVFIDRSRIKEEKFPFRPFRWEKNGRIYDRINIRKWKNRVPDMSRILKFMLPKRVNAGAGIQEIKALVKETCVAEIVHCVLIVLSLAVIFICPGTDGYVLFVICLFLNLPFIFIQRYNRPQYMTAVRRLEEREARKKQCGY